jgi:hypothetical protein
MKKRNQKPPRKMKPVFLVFCEGETEETYVNFLRQKYKLPIKIITHITGLALSQKKIESYIKAEKISLNDRISSFLMYDLDENKIVEKIRACKNSINIASNPSIELWFLLHSSEQNAFISTNACIEKLRKSAKEWECYKKGILTNQQKRILWDNRKTASDRAMKLQKGRNPSTMIYLLLNEMEKTRTASTRRSDR